MSKTVDEALELMKKELEEITKELLKEGYSEEEAKLKCHEILVGGFNMAAEQDGSDIRLEIKENK
jgi:hypothetical protein